MCRVSRGEVIDCSPRLEGHAKDAPIAFDARELVARIEQQMRWRKMLAVDAHTAFAGERINSIARRVSEAGADGVPAPSINDPIWDAEPKRRKEKFAR